MRSITITLVTLLCLNGFAYSQDAIADSTREDWEFQVAFGYWNDNIDWEKSLSSVMKIGKDDYATASFWLLIATDWNNVQWMLDSYLTILTDREADYRTDLLTIRLSQSRPLVFGELQYGTGLIASGNFGGSEIQNGYHKLRDIDVVELTYDEARLTGLIGLLSWENELYRLNRFQINNRICYALRHRAGPSDVHAALEFNYGDRVTRLSSSYRVQTMLGYTHYHRVRRQLTRVFGSGLFGGGLISVELYDRYSAALWFTNNQYGRRQPHFGITFVFGKSGGDVGLGDVLFP